MPDDEIVISDACTATEYVIPIIRCPIDMLGLIRLPRLAVHTVYYF